jgi:PAS domain S-box-containing protein
MAPAPGGAGIPFALLLQLLPVGIYMTDAAGRLTFFNEAAARLWGHRPQLGDSAWWERLRLYWPDGRPIERWELPVLAALEERRAMSAVEAVAARPDGTRVTFLAHPAPIRDPSGALLGAVEVLTEISAPGRSYETAHRLASIVESSDDAIVSKDLDGIVVSWNQGAERLFGYTAEEMVGKPIALLMPPDRHDEEPNILARIRRGERIDHYETIRRRKDGTLVDISLTVSPVRDGAGRIVGASKIARDITERRRAGEQEALLVREMSHRVKNAFAVASAMVTLTARTATTPEAMAEAVRGRLDALGLAHELTLHDPATEGSKADRVTTLLDLAWAILAPFADQPDEEDKRIVIAGPDVPVSGRSATGVALLLHELATNAAKHGALSSRTGHLQVSWHVDGKMLHLSWRERGGPAIDGEPASHGFGSRLALSTARSQLGGDIARDWKPDGLTVHLTVPLERLMPPASQPQR